MRQWMRNIYFLLTNRFSDSKMSKTNNNMEPHKGDSEIITRFRIMNQWMDQITNEFGDRLDKLKRQRVNDHDMVQIRPERKEFNIKRVVMRVNTNVDMFVADNANMSNVDFEDVSVRHEERFGQQQNC